MTRPYITCHMVTSLDGKVTGDFLFRPECEVATEIYYEMHRTYRAQGCDGFICGRVTMEQSFTGGLYPDLSVYQPIGLDPFWPADERLSGYFAVAFDPKGRLGWRSELIGDSDPGYDQARVVEVLTEQVDGRYLAYLRDMNIPYLIAGKDEIDVELALRLFHDRLGVHHLVLEGGSVINGYFLRAACVDEISLVQAPTVAGFESKPLFMEGIIQDFELLDTQNQDGVAVMRYRAKKRCQTEEDI